MLTPEAGEFAEETLQALQDIQSAPDGAVLTGECSPAIDVYETESAIHITADVPGISAASLRIVAKGSAVLIVGEKAPRRRVSEASFHLIERGYGRFARVVRLTAPCDTSQASATLEQGELRVTLPKRPDRRGRTIAVPVSRGRSRP